MIRWRTNNKMTNDNETKTQTMINKRLHRKLKIGWMTRIRFYFIFSTLNSMIQCINRNEMKIKKCHTVWISSKIKSKNCGSRYEINTHNITIHYRSNSWHLNKRWQSETSFMCTRKICVFCVLIPDTKFHWRTYRLAVTLSGSCIVRFISTSS